MQQTSSACGAREKREIKSQRPNIPTESPRPCATLSCGNMLTRKSLLRTPRKRRRRRRNRRGRPTQNLQWKRPQIHWKPEVGRKQQVDLIVTCHVIYTMYHTQDVKQIPHRRKSRTMSQASVGLRSEAKNAQPKSQTRSIARSIRI